MAEASADRWLAAAVDAGRWVTSTAILGPLGRHWPVSRSSARVDLPLYGGQAGVALLLGKLAVVTGEGDFVRAAEDAARNLATAADIGRFGLYSGLAGMAFAADRTARLVGDERLGHDAEAMVDRIVDARVQVGDGAEWPAWANGQGPWQDLFHGTAGIGLTLLRLGRAEVAVEAGSRLVQLAIPADVGHWWRSRPDDTRPAPNIAHGTAGVAYSLATIALVTGRREFADAAIAGAEYLLSVARTDGDTCAVHHDEGDGSGLYTLGWCSGPPGLASLSIRLHQLTTDDEWLHWAERAARTLTISGIPARLYPGFWDNVGQCCGSAGVAEFFLGMHSYTGDPAYLSFASTILDDLVDRGARDGAGLSWHNVDRARTPPELPAETGYMQGAAGVGLALLTDIRPRREPIGAPRYPIRRSGPDELLGSRSAVLIRDAVPFESGFQVRQLSSRDDPASGHPPGLVDRLQCVRPLHEILDAQLVAERHHCVPGTHGQQDHSGPVLSGAGSRLKPMYPPSAEDEASKRVFEITNRHVVTGEPHGLRPAGFEEALVLGVPVEGGLGARGDRIIRPRLVGLLGGRPPLRAGDEVEALVGSGRPSGLTGGPFRTTTRGE